MGISYNPSSTLGFGVAISLIAYFGGVYLNRPSLTETARSFVFLFVGIWAVFIVFTLVRNAKSGF